MSAYIPRMKGVLAAWSLVVGGCAAAGGFGADDAGGTRPTADAPAAADAARVIDGRAIDAAVDARPIDAEPIDAPPDARPIDAPPDACVPQVTQLLLNPAFDLTPVGSDWDQHPIPNIPGGPYPLITGEGEPPQSAPEQAFLGGIDGDDADPEVAHVTDELFQQVTIPANTTQLVVSGFYFVASEEDPGDPTVFDTGDAAMLSTSGTLIEDVLSLTNVTAASMTGYVTFSHTFTTDLAGQTVRLRFTSTNDEINPTAFYFDTLSLEATACD
jgi:hypothetical protein